MTVIGNIIPFDNTQLHILHLVTSNDPQPMNNYAARYQSSAYLIYSKVRNLYQASLASGSMPFKIFSMFYINMTDEQVR